MAASLKEDGTSIHYLNPNGETVFLIPGTVSAGTEFCFEGTVNKQPKRFGLTFQDSRDDPSAVVIHYDVDVEKTQVVIDSKFGKIQRAVEDERQKEFPFQAASSFVILMKVCDGCMEIKINDGKMFDYLFRDKNPLASAKYINISGDVQIRKFSIIKPKLESSTYDLSIPGNAKVGDIYTFVGKALAANNKIDIQFLDQNHRGGDVWFHLTSRFNAITGKSTIIRNSRIDGFWDGEESGPCPPLISGQPFTVDVAVKQDSFLCWVNEKEFGEYKHRKRFQDISAVLIDKSGVINSIKLDRASSHLPPQLSIANALDMARADLMQFFPENPLLVKLSKKMAPGRCIHISGVFKEDAKRFVFSLDKGLREDIVVYDCKAFFENKIVVQNYRNVKWGPEEPIKSDFPFSRGSHFHLQLICDEEGGFHVAVDGIPKFSFPAHLDCGLADHVYVSGDVRIRLLASL